MSKWYVSDLGTRGMNKAYPMLEQPIELASFDNDNTVVLSQKSSNICATDTKTEIRVIIPQQKWWEFIEKIREITVVSTVNTTFCDFRNRSMLVVEAYLRKDEKKDCYFVNMNFAISNLQVPQFLEDLFGAKP